MPASRCPSCGAPHEPRQEYCLGCGTRLPGREGRGAAAASLRRLARGPAEWTWALSALGLVAVAATGIALAARDAGRTSQPTLVTTAPPATTAPPTARVTTLTLTAPTSTTASPPTTAPAPAPSPPAGGVSAWPSGATGYTDVLASVPTSSGRALALALARRAAGAGLPRVGVLLSSDYSSLRAGYWVVFSGVYAGRGQAESALAAAHVRGFPDAYPARVLR